MSNCDSELDFCFHKNNGKICRTEMFYAITTLRYMQYFLWILWVFHFIQVSFYRPQRSLGKVIFSVACVKNSIQRGDLPHCMLGHPPPPGDEGNNRTVRILLECNLVIVYFQDSACSMAADKPRIFLWAAPRTISTAFFRAMMNKSGVKVKTERNLLSNCILHHYESNRALLINLKYCHQFSVFYKV